MRFIILKIVKFLLVPFGIIFTATMPMEENIIILMYHRVNDEIRKELSVSKDNFIWQMNYLKLKGYSVISMDEAYRIMTSGFCGGKYIVLTFDDGYEDYYQYAYPILKLHNYPSTVYIVPGFIETNKIFWWDQDLGESRLMSWKQIIELNNNGLVIIGSHTMNHIDMNTLNSEELETEIVQSQKIISERIKNTVNHFSYPRGIYTIAGVELIRHIYKTAVLMSNGIKIKGRVKYEQLYKLKRIPVQRSDGKYLFIARLKGWLYFEELLRKLKNFAYHQ
jgi:peptidoglycan/xylan/chitin deacetylase (PgdA/CDA1 family)